MNALDLHASSRLICSFNEEFNDNMKNQEHF